MDHHRTELVDVIRRVRNRWRTLEHGDAVERDSIRRHGVALAAIAAITALVVALGPAYLRHGLSALLIISRSAEAASPYRIDVRPGSVKVPRGSDQTIRAKVVGFPAREATVMIRTTPGAAF